MNVRHLVINSNKWFSAVTDYSLQLSRFLNDDGGALVCAHKGSPLLKKSTEYGLQTQSLPLIPYGFFAFLRCWFGLSRMLKHWNASGQTTGHTVSPHRRVVWTFEGREHTLCALHRKFNSKLWQNLILVRVRGQAQDIRASFFNKKLYLKLTDKIVFAAAAVARTAPFYFTNKQAMVQLYCAPQSEAAAPKMSSFDFHADAPAIDFSRPVFLIVGRYDPVKGHQNLIDAFAKAKFEGEFVQLVCIGESQNVKMMNLFEYAKGIFGNGTGFGSRAFVRNHDGKKRIYFFDERVENIRSWIASAHFGVIPSLGSEVICRVAVEFLQAGTPVVASYVGALNEVLTKSPCRVYSSQSEQQCTEALEWAAEVAVDAIELAKFRLSCTNRGRDFDLSHFAKMVSFVSQ